MFVARWNNRPNEYNLLVFRGLTVRDNKEVRGITINATNGETLFLTKEQAIEFVKEINKYINELDQTE